MSDSKAITATLLKEGHSLLRPMRTLGDTARGMPILESRLAYLNKGKPQILARQTRSANLAIGRTRIEEAYYGYTVPEPTWTVLHIPLSCSSDYFFNGREMRFGEAMLATCPSGYFTRGSDRDALTIGMSTELLLQSMRDLSGRNQHNWAFDEVCFRPSDALVRLICAELHPNRFGENASRDVKRSGLMSDYTESLITDRIAFKVLPVLDGTYSGVQSSRRARDVVSDALNASRDSSRIPSLSALCAAAGVSQTRLF